MLHIQHLWLFTLQRVHSFSMRNGNLTMIVDSDNVCYSAGHWCTCCVIAIKPILHSGATEVYNPHGLGNDGNCTLLIHWYYNF